MPSLFDPTTAGDLQLANRIVMAPLTRNRSPEAIPGPLTALYYAQRATAGHLRWWGRTKKAWMVSREKRQGGVRRQG